MACLLSVCDSALACAIQLIPSSLTSASWLVHSGRFAFCTYEIVEAVTGFENGLSKDKAISTCLKDGWFGTLVAT